MLILSIKCAKKWFFLCIFAFLIINQCTSQCVGKECPIKLKLQNNQGQLNGKQVEALAQELRRLYWYYIGDSVLLYKSNIVIADKDALYLLLFRNYIGTFLAIVSRKNNKNEINVNTFARIGAGFIEFKGEKQIQQLKPFTIKINFSDKEFLLDFDEENIAQVAKKVDNNTSVKPILQVKTQIQTKKEVKKIDQHLRKTQDHYLRDAILVDSRPITTSFRNYFISTYINNSGTYLVITSLQKNSNNVQINNLVRIGGGLNKDQIKIITQKL